jgi:glutaredoxin
VKVTVFGRSDCDACKSAIAKMEYFSRKWGKSGEVAIDFFDMDTVEGLSEGAWRDVYDIPTVILERQGAELARWVKQVPISQDFRKYFLEEGADGEPRDKGLC